MNERGVRVGGRGACSAQAKDTLCSTGYCGLDLWIKPLRGEIRGRAKLLGSID
jgi:hypothetical protein